MSRIRRIGSGGLGSPDWSATPTTITSGDTITEDGWLYCYGASSAGSSGDNPARVEVNGKEAMLISGSNTSSEKIGIARAGILVPVSKGDEITAYGGISSMKLYPCKS